VVVVEVVVVVIVVRVVEVVVVTQLKQSPEMIQGGPLTGLLAHSVSAWQRSLVEKSGGVQTPQLKHPLASGVQSAEQAVSQLVALIKVGLQSLKTLHLGCVEEGVQDWRLGSVTAQFVELLPSHMCTV
jgi:hypothetical protein